MHEIDSGCDVAFSGLSERTNAGYDARSAQVFGELGYVIDTQMVALEPVVGLSHSRYKSDTIKEKGGDACLRSDGDQSITQSTIGLRAAKHIDLGREADLIVRGSVGWQHAFGRTQADASMRFAQGGDSFKVEGAPPPWRGTQRWSVPAWTWRSRNAAVFRPTTPASFPTGAATMPSA